jgi:glucokinase
MNATPFTTIAADVGGTRIKLGLVRQGVVLAHDVMDARSHQGLGPQLPRMVESVQRLCQSAGLSRDDCGAMTMAFPSIVDRSSGRVLAHFGKFADAMQLDLPRWSRLELGLPLVIENDARAALIGEWKAGAGRDCDDLVMVTLGTGIGTAALIGGRILRGDHGQAGILGGHLTVRYDGRLCTCGNRGCAEAEASSHALPDLARSHKAFGESRLQRASPIDYAAVFRLADEDDACAMALRQRAIDIWSAAIVNLIHAYDPSRVIIGGGIAAGARSFLPELQRAVLSRAHTPWGRVQILPSQLGDDAALVGCDFLATDGL